MSEFIQYSKFVPCRACGYRLDADLSTVTDVLDSLGVKWELRKRMGSYDSHIGRQYAVFAAEDDLAAHGITIRMLGKDGNGTGAL